MDTSRVGATPGINHRPPESGNQAGDTVPVTARYGDGSQPEPETLRRRYDRSGSRVVSVPDLLQT